MGNVIQIRVGQKLELAGATVECREAGKTEGPLWPHAFSVGFILFAWLLIVWVMEHGRNSK